ncbi:N-acetylglucosaminidase [Clostridium sp. C105KSO13]|uniref:N-acetylglucosaminidase n=1 Tax=Clostridium sp. C105KSO13 TaxID=1776045 RepID=UPI0007407B3B|nr:glucosaminidase domain-containing protein [Clostridium sp. C105KSO13]CUX29181.1 Putative endo-beta-N-acetylglucosaminidase precursor [Clostridium sp. C105KSO13]
MKKRWLAIGLSICLASGMFYSSAISVSAEDQETVQTEGGETVQGQEENDAVADTQEAPAEEETAVPEEVHAPIEEQEPAEDEAPPSEGESNALAAEGETPETEEQVTPVEIQVMDEEGNITFITDDKSPVVEEPPMMARSITLGDKVVNLRANQKGQAYDSNTAVNYTEYGTGEAGYVFGPMGTDAAYLGTFSGKVRFMISGVIGEVSEKDVQLVKMNNVIVSTYYANGSNIIHNIATNLNDDDATSTLNVGPQQSYMKTGTTYYSYDGHYFYTSYSAMLTDYRSGTRKNSINSSNPYYNYFQYLPLRSKTTYTDAQLNSKIQAQTIAESKMLNLGSSLITNQNTYGINALLATGIAGNESAWGISSIAMSKNNLFGLNAVDNNPGGNADTFSSPSNCVQNFAEGWMSRRYCNPNNGVYYGGFLGNKASGINVKYASDPYWGEKAANIAWSLDSAATDRFKYTIGIKDVSGTSHTDLNVRAGSNTLSTTFFTTGGQTGYSFLILGKENGFYKVQSDPVLNAGRTAINSTSGAYNFSNMYAYTSADYLTVVSGNVSPSPNPGTGTGDTLMVRRGNAYYFKYTLSDGESDLMVNYGYKNDEVYVGDWDGDGVDSLCVRRGNVYYFKNSLTPGEADSVVRYGKAEDEVLIGDWNGDGTDTLCVRRGNAYHIKNSLSEGKADHVVLYGRKNDDVLVGDWNADGMDTLCVRRGKTYYFKDSLSNGEADAEIIYGKADDQIMAGDWNGDRKDTLCVRRGNAYHIKNSIAVGEADAIVLYGKANDITYAGTWKK